MFVWLCDGIYLQRSLLLRHCSLLCCSILSLTATISCSYRIHPQSRSLLSDLSTRQNKCYVMVDAIYVTWRLLWAIQRCHAPPLPSSQCTSIHTQIHFQNDNQSRKPPNYIYSVRAHPLSNVPLRPSTII